MVQRNHTPRRSSQKVTQIQYELLPPYKHSCELSVCNSLCGNCPVHDPTLSETRGRITLYDRDASIFKLFSLYSGIRDTWKKNKGRLKCNLHYSVWSIQCKMDVKFVNTKIIVFELNGVLILCSFPHQLTITMTKAPGKSKDQLIIFLRLKNWNWRGVIFTFFYKLIFNIT